MDTGYQHKIAVIGLGYVGLPLAIEFSKKYEVVGFDIDEKRVAELQNGNDYTQETDPETLLQALTLGLSISSDASSLAGCNTYIITVPTPINQSNQPDLQYLFAASEIVGKVIRKGDIVIYESTTYPGCTEEDCIPVVEQVSKLKYNIDFYAGYSPERINPGDKVNTLSKIKKVTSGSTPEIAEVVDTLYASIITAGTHKAPSIKVAEASKIIENAQRDVNISFINELALIFDKMNIDTNDVLDAAATKWNFIKYRPGLVGGHCISVDPYYLATKAEALGYTPQVILSGRQVNNSIAPFIANKVAKLLTQRNRTLKGANILILGFSFKENCPDTRNTKVIDIYNEFREFGMCIDICDPWVCPQKVADEYGVSILSKIDRVKQYDAIVLTVAHNEFKEFDFAKYHNSGTVIFDTKGIIDRNFVDGRL